MTVRRLLDKARDDLEKAQQELSDIKPTLRDAERNVRVKNNLPMRH